MLHIFTLFFMLFSFLFISPQEVMSGIVVGTPLVGGIQYGIEIVGQQGTATSTNSKGAPATMYFTFTPEHSGTISRGHWNVAVVTDDTHLMAVYNSDASARLGVSDTIVGGLAIGTNDFTFSTPVSVTGGVTYNIASSANGACDWGDLIGAINEANQDNDVTCPDSALTADTVSHKPLIWLEVDYVL